ncbi:MAG: hypothetical protein QM796_09350 [Chthoniobacteraceae bacterium]
MTYFRDFKPGTGMAAQIKKADGQTVSFVVLTAAQGKSLWRLPLAGRDRVILSSATVYADQDRLQMQSTAGDFALSVFPPLPGVAVGDLKVKGSADGVFARFVPPAPQALATVQVPVVQEQAAGPKATTLQGMQEATWADAAVYQLKIPAIANGRQLILNVHYVGDAARLYVGDKLFGDHFYNGDAFPIALWRIPASDWSKIRLKVLPYSDALLNRLPAEAKNAVAKARATNALDAISVTTEEPREISVKPL